MSGDPVFIDTLLSKAHSLIQKAVFYVFTANIMDLILNVIYKGLL